MRGANTPYGTPQLEKAMTGIAGLDEITGGGLPRGRPTLICGGAGCGKTLFSMEFLVHGALHFEEPGVFMAFEETGGELAANVASLGIDLNKLVADNRIALDYVQIEPGEVETSGDYDLEALFIRLEYAIDRIGARRVVLDTLEVLFGVLPDQAILRAEMRRLFRWLKEKGVTALITAERGEGALTRYGFEEYVSDCVILLDHRVSEQVSTRRLRVVKYRGSAHGTNEFPFLIDESGFSVLPLTSAGLDHAVSEDRISTGVPDLDDMLDKAGYFRGSTVLVSGTAGTGKTSLASHFVAAACARGEKALYFAFEESPQQILRNMRSIGIDLQRWMDRGLLKIVTARPTVHGLEMHLAVMHRQIREFQPDVVVVDPVTSFLAVGGAVDTRALLTRLVDFLKSRQITTLFTSLSDVERLEETSVGISSIIDTWILLRELELNSERNRGIYILKSRGMRHSNQVREFLLTEEGIKLVDVYLGPGGVLAGSARMAQEAAEAAEELARQQETERLRLSLDRKRRALEARIAAMRAEFDAEAEEIDRLISHDRDREELRSEGRGAIAKRRR